MAIPIAPTMAIPNVPAELEPNVHEDIVIKSNVDELIEEDGNQIDMDGVQSHVYHIHQLSANIFPLMLPTPS